MVILYMILVYGKVLKDLMLVGIVVRYWVMVV